MIAGADWFEGIWLVVVEDEVGQIAVRRVPEFPDFLGWQDLTTLVVDVPIGLPDRGARSCDQQARRIVKPRGSSVFPVPIRRVLNANTYSEASEIWESVEGKRCSVFSFGIFRTIAGVDRHMTPERQRQIREGHPELSFAHMNGGSGLKHSKHAPEGQRRRIELLEPHFPDLGAHISGLRQQRASVDLLDAFAMLWTARRVRNGEAVSIPDQPEYDPRGLRMEMVA